MKFFKRKNSRPGLGSKTNKNKESLKIISLGGWGKVTQNLFAYQYKNQILVVDCGVGFPDEESPEGDLLVANVDYLVKNREKIQGIVITHGHEDHYGGLPFVLPKLNRQIPIYASRLTTALIKEKLEDYRQEAKIKLIDSRAKVNLGHFNLEFIYLTHSIPDTFGIAISTSLGTILHISDYKFDWTPMMGSISDVSKLATVGNRGVVCMLSDCLRSEKAGYTLSESMVEDSLEREIRDCRGKVFITTISSNVSRWQQALNVSVKYGRQVALVGRSIEKIFKIATRLGYLKIPKGVMVPTKKINSLPREKISLFVAGSQAQKGSALERITAGEFREVQIEPGDKVIFSSPDYIPGTQLAIHKLIDNLSRLGATVSYSDILDDLHVSVLPETFVFVKKKGIIRAQRISEISGKIKAASFDHQTLKIKWKPAKLIKHNYKGKVFHLTTKSGRSVKVTSGHSLFVLKNSQIREIKGEKIKIGDYLLIPKVLPSGSLKELKIRNYIDFPSKNYKEENGMIFYNNNPICRSVIKLDADFGRLLGYYLAEGSAPRHISLVFGPHEKHLVDDARALIRTYFDCKSKLRQEHSLEITFGSVILQRLFRDWFGSKAKNKQIPSFVFSSPKECKFGFLAGYLMGDGSIDSSQGYFRFRAKTASEKLASDVLYLLSQLSLCGRFDHLELVSERVINGNKLKPSSCYVIRLQGEKMLKSLLPYFSRDFQRRIKIYLESIRNKNVYSPEGLPIKEINLPEEVVARKSTTLFYISQKILDKRPLNQAHINPEIILRDAVSIHNPLSKMVAGDLLFDSVKKIEVKSYNGDVYDLSVPGSENFVGGFGGIVLHNSGHAAQAELSLMIGLARSEYLIPIGGAFRQMRQYALLAQRMGYKEEKIVLPDRNDTIEIMVNGQVKLGPQLPSKTRLVRSKSRRKRQRR